MIVCLSLVIFNICYNFWTVKDRVFIIAIHTSLMTPFQNDTKVSDLDFYLCAENSFLGPLLSGHSVSQKHVFFKHIKNSFQ